MSTRDLRALLFSVPEAERTQCMRWHVRAYELMDEVASLCKGKSVCKDINRAMRDPQALRACACVVLAMELCDYRIQMSEAFMRVPVVEVCFHVSPTPDLPVDAPGLERARSRQLVNLLPAQGLVIFASAWAMHFTSGIDFAPLVLRVLNELRLHLDVGLLADDAEWEREGPWRAVGKRALSHAVSLLALKVARRIFRQPVAQRGGTRLGQIDAQHGALENGRLLDQIGRHANACIRARPEAPFAHGALGWLANQDAPTKPLSAPADALHCYRRCLELADAAGDDVMRCIARIDACAMLVQGGEGWVGLPMSGGGGVVRRDLRETYRSAGTQPLQIEVFPAQRAAEVQRRELQRASDPVRRAQLEPGEKQLVVHWKLLPVWREAKAIMAELERWGMDEAAFGESFGYQVCGSFELMVSRANDGRGLAEGNYANAAVMSVPRGVKTDGRTDRGMDESRLRCSSCGKLSKEGKLQVCSKCEKACYCNRECQAEHWKKGGHKEVCGKTV